MTVKGSTGLESFHKDRGDGVCLHCFEDYPCDGSRGAVWSGVQALEQEEFLMGFREEQAKRNGKINEINETMARLGIDWRMAEHSVATMIGIDEMHAVIERIWQLESHSKKPSQ